MELRLAVSFVCCILAAPIRLSPVYRIDETGSSCALSSIHASYQSEPSRDINACAAAPRREISTRSRSPRPGKGRKRKETEATPSLPVDPVEAPVPGQASSPETAANEIWPLDGGFQWIQAGQRFVGVRSESGEEFRVLDHPAIDKVPIATANCPRRTCEGIFPAEFYRCPFCCTGLNRPVQSMVWKAWYDAIARGGCETTLILRTSRGEEQASISEVRLPDGGDFAFVSSPEGQRLYAFDRRTGLLHAKARVGEEWKELTEAVLTDSLPPWSWSCAMDKRGFALVTDEGPGWILLPWVPGRKFEVPAIEPGAVIECLSGVGLSDGVIVAPVLLNDRLMLCWRSESSDRWQLKPVDGARKGREAIVGPSGDRNDFLGAPAQDAKRNLYWAGVNGYLFCDPQDGQIQEAGWVPWPNGQFGVPQHRPAADVGQSLYQLTMTETETPDGREVQYFACRMQQLRGQQALRGPIDYARVRSPFFSCGRTSVYENERFREPPWVPGALTDRVAPDGMSVLPFLVLGVHDGERHGIQWVYARAKRDEVPSGARAAKNRDRFLVDVCFADRSLATMELKLGVTIQSVFDLSLFLHADQLHLYDASENRLYRLPLWAEER